MSAARMLPATPRRRMLDTDKIDTVSASFEYELSRRVIGQPEAVEQIVEVYTTYITGLSAIGRTVGNFLFLGPTGSGKTRAVEATAEALGFPTHAVLKVDCAEFQHSHEIAKLIGCFTPETPILLADGSRKPINAIAVGDNVVTREGRARPVTYLHEYQHDGEMVEIKFSSHNQPLVATPGHKILAIKTNKSSGRVRCPKSLYCKDNLDWVSAGDLERNDIVAYPRFKVDQNKFIETIDLLDYLFDDPEIHYDDKSVWFKEHAKTNRFIAVNEDFVRFAGYFVSDGCTRNSKSGIHFTLGVPQKAEVVSDLLSLLPRIFGVYDQVKLTPKGKNCVRIVISSKVLAILTAKLFGPHTLKKRIPEFLLHAPEPLTWHLVDAALMCDGSVVVRRRVDFSTSSETLYSQLQLLLRKLGFTTQAQKHPSIRYGKRGADRYRIYVAGEQIDKFAYQLPLSGKKIKLENPGNSGIQRESHVDEDYVYFRIRSTDRVRYTGPVYDFSVDEDTSYVAENILVSNSPPGYLGHRETHAALSQNKLNQFHTEKVKLSFVLFDEIEKASDSLWNLLLGILDKATLTLGDNSKVDFSRCFVFLTSNLGAAEMANLVSPKLGFQGHEHKPSAAHDKRMNDSGVNAARRKFTPEFMNRIDKTVVFKALGESELRRILDIELAQVQCRVVGSANGAFIFTVTKSGKEFLLRTGTDTKYGARHLKRAIETSLVRPLARLIASGQIDPGDCIEISAAECGNKLCFEWVNGDQDIQSMAELVRNNLGIATA